MKKKGFTLIELLAVIVILAIIALIATPMIMDVIEKARKSAAIDSVNGLLESAEQYQYESMLDGVEPSKTIDLTSDLLKHKGAKPDSGTLIIGENGKMSVVAQYGKYCIEKGFNDASPQVVDESVCTVEYEVTLKLNENEIEKQVISKRALTTFDISDIDLSTVTNISCNQGTRPTINENKLTVDGIHEDVTCTLSSTLQNTAQTLDSSETTILMLNDEGISEAIELPENTNVILNLNNHTINLNGNLFRTYGDLIINGTSDSKIVSNVQVVNNNGTGTVTINGGNYERTDGMGATIYNQGTGTITINDAHVLNSAMGVCVQNGHPDNENNGSIIINGGIFISENGSSIVNGAPEGTTYITQTENPIYITSLAQAWRPAVSNSSTGTIYIEGKEANQCTSNANDTTSGLCIYAEGDKAYDQATANGGVTNHSSGKIYISGGTIYGGNQAINNSRDGSIFITDGKIISNKRGVLNNSNGTIKMCKGSINALYPFVQSSNDGYIYYKNDVSWNSDGNFSGIDRIVLDENLICN